MLAAKALLEGDVPLGYAVMSLGAVQLDELFSAYAGSGGILLLDPYWDCVYRSANAGGEDLAPLRAGKRRIRFHAALQAAGTRG